MNIVINATRIIGTHTVIYSAYAPRTELKDPRSIFYIDGVCHGKIGSDPDPIIYQHLPVGPERTAAVNRAYMDRYDVAYSAILAAHPELLTKEIRRDMGRIEVQIPR